MTADGSQSTAPLRWEEEEDNILRAYVQQQTNLGFINDWKHAAEHLPRRTSRDCRKRWMNHLCGGLTKGQWEAHEDAILRSAVAQHGQRWTLVAGEVGSRSADQCAKRWQHNLDPRLSRQRWTPKEDELLLESVERYGREWRKIQEKHYGTRSANDLKNRFTALSKKIRSRASSPGQYTSRRSSPSDDFEEQHPTSASLSTSHQHMSSHPRSDMALEEQDNNSNRDPNASCQSRSFTTRQKNQTILNNHTQHNLSFPLPLNNQLMTTVSSMDDIEPALTATSTNTSIFSWPVETSLLPPPPPPPSLRTSRSHSLDDLMQDGLITNTDMQYFGLENTTDNDGICMNTQQQATDFDPAHFALAFDNLDSVTADVGKEGQLQSLLVQRAHDLATSSPSGNISVQGGGFNREVLIYLLDVLLPIRNKVKIDISM